jgi:hypothetical protein
MGLSQNFGISGVELLGSTIAVSSIHVNWFKSIKYFKDHYFNNVVLDIKVHQNPLTERVANEELCSPHKKLHYEQRTSNNLNALLPPIWEML